MSSLESWVDSFYPTNSKHSLTAYNIYHVYIQADTQSLKYKMNELLAILCTAKNTKSKATICCIIISHPRPHSFRSFAIIAIIGHAQIVYHCAVIFTTM